MSVGKDANYNVDSLIQGVGKIILIYWEFGTISPLLFDDWILLLIFSTFKGIVLKLKSLTDYLLNSKLLRLGY